MTDPPAQRAAATRRPWPPISRTRLPASTLVFEAIRHDFEGEDKRKQDRVRKFYAAIPDVVELQKYSPHEARAEAESLIRQAGFRMEPAALDLLIEALGAEIARVAVEIEKLSLFAGDRVIGVDDITALVPDARATTIFALVNALGRRDRARALGILDTLTREGEYLPLALAFLSTQFRMALVAREAGLKSSQQIQGHFSRLGVPMWGSRAEQVYQTVSKFSKAADGARAGVDLSGGQRPARCASGRPHRHGDLYYGVGELERQAFRLLSYAASAFTRRCSLLLYRAAVFFLMMPALGGPVNHGECGGEQRRGSLYILRRSMRDASRGSGAADAICSCG